MISKCYAYDDELMICMLYGIDCTSSCENICYHENKEEFKLLKENKNV